MEKRPFVADVKFSLIPVISCAFYFDKRGAAVKQKAFFTYIFRGLLRLRAAFKKIIGMEPRDPNLFNKVYQPKTWIEYAKEAIVVLNINTNEYISPIVSVNVSFFITIVFIVLNFLFVIIGRTHAISV